LDHVCSFHFKDDDILTETKQRGDLKFLKRDAVPSIFTSSQTSSETLINPLISIQLNEKCRFCLKEINSDQKTINDLLDLQNISIADAVLTTFGIDVSHLI
jgi:hypothetical protein